MKFELNEKTNEYILVAGDDVPTVDIPREYDGRPVTSIGVCAFCGCTTLTNVTIEDGVTSIDTCAFNRCTSLNSITIPNSVTSIGQFAFSGCTSLRSVRIPDSVTDIGDWAFYSCTSLTSVHYNGDMVSWDKITFGDVWANPLYYGATLHAEHMKENEEKAKGERK